MNKSTWKDINYDNFSKEFSDSRKNMKWEEIDYFLWILKKNKYCTKLNRESLANKCTNNKKNTKSSSKSQGLSILDIWCGGWRLLWELLKKEVNISNYLWIDLSNWMLKEAISNYPYYNFKHLNMLELLNLKDKNFNCIFFIASFHHLKNTNDRLKVLKSLHNILEKGSMVFMTNWYLIESDNYKKYKNRIIDNSKNSFWGLDFKIKFWKFDRFYHWFNLKELRYLFFKSWFDIIENRIFDWKKNIISIIKKA